MLVNRFSSVGYSQSVSKTTQSRVNLPPNILSKTSPKMSDEEFESKIWQMAKYDYYAGRFQSNDANSDFFALERSYISVVSPNREEMINNALPSILNKIRDYMNTSTTKEFNSYEEMIMALLFGIEPMSSTTLNLGQGGKPLYDVKDGNNNTVATLTTRGWEVSYTPAESARSKEFLEIYNKAWDFTAGVEKHGYVIGISNKEPLPKGIIYPNARQLEPVFMDSPSLTPNQKQQIAQHTAALYEANLHGASK